MNDEEMNDEEMNDEERMIDYKDMKTIELTYEGHCSMPLEDVFDGDTNLFAEGKVKQWWVKYGTLYMELHDGREIERDVSYWVGYAYENVDTKYPTAIMVEDKKGVWHRRDVA